MPNHIATNLKITGPKESVQKFVDMAPNKEDEISFSFGSFLPMPEEIRNTTSPSRTTNQELIDKYGSDNWYDWALTNYGTKWECYDVAEWNVSLDGEEAGIYYQTAWSPATAFYKTVSKNFPDLKFFHEFADEGGCFVGDETIQNGEIIEEHSHEWESEAGIIIRQNVGYYHEEDEEVEA